MLTIQFFIFLGTVALQHCYSPNWKQRVSSISHRHLVSLMVHGLFTFAECAATQLTSRWWEQWNEIGDKWGNTSSMNIFTNFLLNPILKKIWDFLAWLPRCYKISKAKLIQHHQKARENIKPRTRFELGTPHSHNVCRHVITDSGER
jgi:hypothetical protein